MAPHATDDRTVGAVEPDSAAAAVGMEPGDVIVAVDGKDIANYEQLDKKLKEDWPRGKKDVTLTVRRAGTTLALPAFTPRTIGLIRPQRCTNRSRCF